MSALGPKRLPRRSSGLPPTADAATIMIELNYEAAKENGVSAPKETREDIGAKLAS